MNRKKQTYLDKPVDLDSWQRAEHFALFKDFSQPYFNVCVRLNLGHVYKVCKAHKLPFFQAYIYLTLQACNQYQPMRLRIIDEQPWQLRAIRASVVELADDDSFRFSYFDLHDNVVEFAQHATRQSQTAKAQNLFCDDFNNTEGHADLIHISVLPWLNFTGFSHAINAGVISGIPKLVFGEYDPQTGSIPLSVDVHHALMDGLHVARFIQLLQSLCDNFVIESW